MESKERRGAPNYRVTAEQVERRRHLRIKQPFISSEMDCNYYTAALSVPLLLLYSTYSRTVRGLCLVLHTAVKTNIRST